MNNAFSDPHQQKMETDKILDAHQTDCCIVGEGNCHETCNISHPWLNSSSDHLDRSASPSPNRPNIKKALRAIAQTIRKAIYDWLICSSEPIISERWGDDTHT